MKQVIEVFTKRLEKQSYLSPFFKLQDFVITLSSNEERVSIHLKKRSCQVIMDDIQNENVIEINGCSDTLLHLIQGNEKLSTLIKENKITVNASYRVVLKLESIFFLSGQQSRNAM